VSDLTCYGFTFYGTDPSPKTFFSANAVDTHCICVICGKSFYSNNTQVVCPECSGNKSPTQSESPQAGDVVEVIGNGYHYTTKWHEGLYFTPSEKFAILIRADALARIVSDIRSKQ
jgi:hypothetical protein